MSVSHFVIALKSTFIKPGALKPSSDGSNSTSGHRKRSWPMVYMVKDEPSGSSYDFSSDASLVAICEHA
eukprot:3562851-Prymnesium_polylepis.1